MRRLLLCAALVACGSKTETAENIDLFGQLPSVEPVVVAGSLGPVRAEVRVRPAKPRLGDVVYLELSVESPEAIDITMPEFGEALGRFSIVDYDWRESREGDKFVREQLYQLQAAASGKVRLPQLRIEVVDRRPGAEGGSEPQELLTDEVLIDVAKVELDADATFRPGLGRIEIAELMPWHHWWFWAILAGVIVAIALGLTIKLVKKAKVAARANAYELARRRLAQLRAAGLPADDEIDSWYVELSSVVRHYLEGRFSVRAPELTTEEFLREAQRSAELTGDHRELLSGFLAGCDRVKFAGHVPSGEEQTAALDLALRFVEDTRPAEHVEAAA